MSTEVLQDKPKKPQTEGTKYPRLNITKRSKIMKHTKNKLKKILRSIMKITKTTF